MYFSVIIPTANRPEAVENTLVSLTAQTLSEDRFEVIVVENGAVGDTKNVTENFKNKITNLYYLHEPVPGLLAGRHRGVSVATGDILIFIDDDIVADKGWLEAIAQTFKDPEVHLVGGRNLPRYEIDPPAWVETFWDVGNNGNKWCGYLSVLDFGEEYRMIDPSFIWGLNFSVRKDTLVSLEGFHPDGYPWELRRYRGDGEMTICWKAKERGLKTIYQPKALVYHVIPQSRLTIEYFEKRGHLQGISDSYTNIRENGGLMQNKTSNKTLKLKTPIQKLKNIAARLIYPQTTISYPEIKKRVKNAYLAGYEYHENEVRKDIGLLKWVLKENYWDYELPNNY